MFKKLRKVLSNNRGFTILELIVVIAIMGFLVALVAPKLVGVSENSKEPIVVTSMQRLSEAVERHITETGKLPNNLNGGNLKGGLLEGGGDPLKYQGSLIWDGQTNDKNKTFNLDFVMKNYLHLHTLNTSEAEEIKALGITHVIDPITGKMSAIQGAETNAQNDRLVEGTVVLMIGSGTGFFGSTNIPNGPQYTKLIDSGDSSLYDKDHTLHYDDGKATNKMNRPDLVYRIVLGVGEESDVAKKGLLSNVGTHPIGIQHKDNIKFTDYSIVLPRLQATVDRLHKGPEFQGGRRKSAYISCEAEGLDKEENLIIPNKTIDFTEAQGINDFEIMGIGGETYPTKEVYEWKIKSLKHANSGHGVKTIDY